MKGKPGGFVFLQSRVARRVFAKFVVCALAPLALVAGVALYQTDTHLSEEAQRRLRLSNKDAGTWLVERLELLETQAVAAWAQSVGGTDLGPLNTPSDYRQYFRSITVLAVLDGRVLDANLLANGIGLVDRQWQHLRRGGTVLATGSPGRNPRTAIFLVIPDRVRQGDRLLLAAEINPAYLWRGEVFQNKGGGFAVLGPNAEILHVTSPQVVPPNDLLLHETAGLANIDWRQGANATSQMSESCSSGPYTGSTGHCFGVRKQPIFLPAG